MDEWNGIQERLKKVFYKIKLPINKVMCQLAFPETTLLGPPPKKIQTKSAKERVRSTPNEAFTGQIPSL
ncbi:hypothetical protein MTR_6g477840 [Medicago truncatula]|uniref:Uncharacterized protein n=1 Tax=Medicago truncatula TaxID=3880 RepID=A0A072ULZ8_MEDTR|nr:hypothetical protein MTR_6g477840 [Medicago truncatula]